LKSSWVTILQGVEFSIFVLILAWALQQCSATALPVIVAYDMHYARLCHERRVCLSVCLSVTAVIESRQINIRSCGFHRLVAQRDHRVRGHMEQSLQGL